MRSWSRRDVLAAGAAAGLVIPTRSLATPPDKPDDASIAVRLLSRYHPGLLRYQSGDDWARSVTRFARDWRAQNSLEERFLLLSGLTASIRCGHTHCNPYNQPDTVAALMDGKRLLPFHFDWLGGRMVVTADPHEAGLAQGTEILAINGERAAEHLASLLPLTRADGSLDNKRRALLSVSGAAYETYDLFTAARKRFGETVVLSVRERDVAPRDVTVPTINFAQRRAAVTEDTGAGDQPLWTLRRDGAVAVLTMPTWAVFNSDWDWRSWLAAAFAGLADTKGLVIDLRGNEGGLDACGAALLSYCVSEPVRIPATRSLTRISTVAEEDRPYLDTWDESFFTIGASFAVAGPGFRIVPGDEELVITPSDVAYGGAIAVLVDASNSSATGIFAETVKRTGIATLVGEETGRNRRGGNGGAFFFARLPDSGLEFDIPLVGGFAPGDPPDAGTTPDLTVERTPQTIASGEDRAMVAARALFA